MSAWLDVNDVHKRFGATVALAGVTLSVERGEVVCLLGGSGAGKTTLLEPAVGFDRADAGTIRIGGIDPAADSLAARRHAAYLPETIALYESLTARETMEYFRSLNGLAQLDSAAVRALFAGVALAADVVDRPVRDFSKGMRQKVALAVAMSRDVEGLLLDEPTTALDPAVTQELATALRAAANRGLAVLIATHDLAFVEALADRAVVVQRGRVRDELTRPRFGAHGLAEFYARSLQGAD
jgi:ABC-2 type transport system ATP-binding protein